MRLRAPHGRVAYCRGWAGCSRSGVHFPRTAPCVLRSPAGWTKNDEANTLVLMDETRSDELLRVALQTLDDAIAARAFA